jgi:hypothetical protein
MSRYDPDISKPATPRSVQLRANETIWRIHDNGFAPEAYNPTIPPLPPPGGPVQGGRFDATTIDPYEYLYAGRDTVAAAAETIFRDRPPTQQAYIVPAIKLRNRSMSRLRVTQNLVLTKLHGSGLSAIGQDAWLTACGASDYPCTRLWASAIRHWDPTTCGLAWHPRNDNDRLAYVLFQDRCPAGVLIALATLPLDRPGPGFRLLQRAAAKHHAVVSLP